MKCSSSQGNSMVCHEQQCMFFQANYVLPILQWYGNLLLCSKENTDFKHASETRPIGCDGPGHVGSRGKGAEQCVFGVSKVNNAIAFLY